MSGTDGSGEAWTEVGDRVYVRRHRELDLNITLVVGEDACLVVDTRSTEPEGAELAAAVRTITPHPWIVVNTHFHYDHTLGNAAFRPAEFWAHRRTLEVLAGPEGTAMRTRVADRYRAAGRAEEARLIGSAQLVAPTEVVDDVAELAVGGRPVVLRHLGRGHTDGDLVVQLPDVDLLVAGDLVEEGAPPQFGDAYPLDWPATMDAVAALAGGAVVPGHGAVVDREFVRGQGAELARLAAVARTGYAEGRPAVDVAGELPYFGRFAQQAVERAYRQLTEAPTPH